MKVLALAIGGSFDGEWIEHDGPASSSGLYCRKVRHQSYERALLLLGTHSNFPDPLFQPAEEYKLQTLHWSFGEYQFWVCVGLPLDEALDMLMKGYRQPKSEDYGRSQTQTNRG